MEPQRPDHALLQRCKFIAIEEPRAGPLRAIIQQPAQLERKVRVPEPLRDLVELGDC